jgi:hypothetical protein
MSEECMRAYVRHELPAEEDGEGWNEHEGAVQPGLMATQQENNAEMEQLQARMRSLQQANKQLRLAMIHEDI